MSLAILRLTWYALFSALGGAVIYEDWRWHKIRNSRVLLALGLCAAGYAVLSIGAIAVGHSWLGSWRVDFELPDGFWRSVLIHGVFTLVIGVTFWLSEVWAPGDAKLFMAASLFLPLGDRALARIPYSLFLILLINIFIPAGAYLTIRMAWTYGKRLTLRLKSMDFSRDWLKAVLKERTASLGLGHLRTAVGILALFLLSNFLRFYLARITTHWQPIYGLLNLLILLNWDVVLQTIRDRLGNGLLYLLILYLSAGLVFFPAFLGQHLGRVAHIFVSVGAVVLVLRPVLMRGARGIEGRSISAADVRTGMVPLDMKLDLNLDWKEFGELAPTGLSERQAVLLRAWGKDKGDTGLITILGGNAFAPWIVAGAALTLILQRDILFLAFKWLR